MRILRNLERKWTDSRLKICNSTLKVVISDKKVIETFWQPTPRVESIETKIAKPVAPFSQEASANYRATIDLVRT